jgi:glycosyltransferase involved in cell wall biosynthesis
MKLSIIVCTRNRADELVHCLQELMCQAAEAEATEIIIVDNGSTDHTAEVAARFTMDSRARFRYIHEPVPGLCVARNRGRAAAEGEFLAYIDDDAVPHPAWIARIMKHLGDAGCDCLAGKTVLRPNGEIPEWFPGGLYWALGMSSFGDDARFLGGNENPSGNNFAIRAEVFDAVSGFDSSLSLYFDEAEFFSRVRAKGHRFFYDPELIVDHRVPTSRLTRGALRRRAYRMGIGVGQYYKVGKPGIVLRLGQLGRYMALAACVGGLWCVRPRFGREFAFWQYVGCVREICAP